MGAPTSAATPGRAAPVARIPHQARRGRGMRHGVGEQSSERLRREASIKRSIADAVVIKDGDLFFVSQPSGDVPPGGAHGLGLHHHDCRFLNGYELTLDGQTPTALDVDASRAFAASFLLTVDLRFEERGGVVEVDVLGVKGDLAVRVTHE